MPIYAVNAEPVNSGLWKPPQDRTIDPDSTIWTGVRNPRNGRLPWISGARACGGVAWRAQGKIDGEILGNRHWV
jgi:hypothetical protein